MRAGTKNLLATDLTGRSMTYVRDACGNAILVDGWYGERVLRLRLEQPTTCGSSMRFGNETTFSYEHSSRL